MKKSTCIVVCLFLLSCNFSNNRINHNKIAEGYFKARNELDYDQVKKFLADTIKEIEGVDTMVYSRVAYREKFLWDSVFNPHIDVTTIRQIPDGVLATLAISSKRFEFLGNNPLKLVQKILFNGKQITQIEITEYFDADWEIWQSRRDSLVKWTDQIHPELSGFVNDLTKNGGEKYLKAIELFIKSKKE